MVTDSGFRFGQRSGHIEFLIGLFQAISFNAFVNWPCMRKVWL
jgi:hypothetical protein